VRLHLILTVLEVDGDSVPVVERVVMKPGGFANFSIGRNGSLVDISGEHTEGTRTAVWVDRDGREELTGVPPRSYTSRNGLELFYYVAPGKLMTVPMHPGSSFTAGLPQVVFEGLHLLTRREII
jgi:hypothetical protein